MSVALEIRDGDPWFFSPALRLIDPADASTEVMPVAGAPCYIEARVRNTGDRRVENATVRFYWANPAAGFNRSTANMVGTAFVTLEPGGDEDVLCLSPWVPSPINDGHSCILAEAFHSSLDPLPATVDFSVPTDRHVAQRNLSVISATKMNFAFRFEVHNTDDRQRGFILTVEQRALDTALELLGFQKDRFSAKTQVKSMGFTDQRCYSEVDVGQLRPKIQMSLPAHARTALSVAGTLESDGAALLVVEQLAEDTGTQIGGLGIVIVEG
ncbi:hypothetical protein ACVBEQ_24810 [Nakamurella sp. GG22]